MVDTYTLYDIAIIGAGPAGMASAIQAGRHGQSVVIIDKENYGGQMIWAPKIENYPGFTKTSGQKLTNYFYNQMMSYSTVTHKVGRAVLIKYNRGIFMTYLEDRTVVSSRSIVVATGTDIKPYSLATKNIYYTAVGLKPILKNKKMVVLGSNNIAANNARELATYCEHVYICDSTFEMQCEYSFIKELAANEKISFLPNCKIKAFNTDAEGNLTAVILDTLAVIETAGLLVAEERLPQADFTTVFTDRDANGFIITDKNGKTGQVPGVFAAGDCKNKKYKRVFTAVYDGIMAANEAIDFVKAQKAK